MILAEWIILLGLLGQMALNGYWAYRVMEYEQLVEGEDARRLPYLLFVVGVFFFGLSVVGFLNTLTLTAASLFYVAGFLAAVTALCSAVEATAYMQHLGERNKAYLPKP